MATSSSAPRPAGPNTAFRKLRGALSPGEFAAAVRRAAGEIGERVSCDARYIGRVEAGEIRCPNYAYERVFLHMFPGRSLTDLGFEPRQVVRRRMPRTGPPTALCPAPSAAPGAGDIDDQEEGDVLRRAFMTGGPAAVASLATLGALPAAAGAARPGGPEAAAVTRAVTDLRLLDDRHGADALYRPAREALRAAYELLDTGARRQAVDDQLHADAGELAISVGWLAHDSGRPALARSHYGEALATARVGGDPALEAHVFCNAAFLAADTGCPREAVRAAQAGQQAARRLGSDRLRALLALREAGGWAGMGDRRGAEVALARAHTHYGRGSVTGAPEWMSFFGDAEFASLEARCWAALGDWPRAGACARQAVAAALREPHFARNTALYAAELAGYLTERGEPEEAAAFGHRSLDLLTQVRSARVTGLLAGTAERLGPARRDATVATFLERRGA
ncbi:hypothetical protein [Streptomyces litchfieldiae]|uniref:C1 regulatory protein n=1 Tax=Streptomyces litchfieldiae TaxID=3075543 RepID=A0ABU2MM15_9ACTN|nr:hypothetical protein [Streptomyces sp. DSM 44938]MDT0342656.1 hypothetical protein [Streptomyces sp. DSM 44938]